MTDIIKQTRPYELLFRWDDQGRLSGAHYSKRELYRDGNEIVADRIIDPVPVALGDNDGFPLAEILSPEQINAAASVNQAIMERDAAIAERDAARDFADRLKASLGGSGSA